MRLLRLGLSLASDVAKDLWRHRGQNAMAVVTLASGLMLAGGGLLLVESLGRWVDQLSRQARVTLWAAPGGTLDQAEAILGRDPRVAGVQRLSAEENTRRFRELSRESGLLLDALGSEPLPESLEVQLRTDLSSGPRAMEAAETFQKLPGVADVLADQERLEQVQRQALLARRGLALLGLVLLLAAGFTTGNVIRMTLTLREDEIAIMRLVGASEGFIRTPLLLEGACLGLAGSLLAVGGLYALWVPAAKGVGGFSPFLVNLARQGFFSPQSLGLLAAVGTTTGALGSAWGFWMTRRAEQVRERALEDAAG